MLKFECIKAIILFSLTTLPPQHTALSSSDSNSQITFQSNHYQLHSTYPSYHGLTSAGQDLWIQSEAELEHITTTCPNSLIFSLAPSEINRALIYQTSQSNPNLDQWWTDDLSTLLTGLRHREESHVIEYNQSDCKSTILHVNKTVLLRLPYRSLRSFVSLLPTHIDAVVHQFHSNLHSHPVKIDSTLQQELGKIRYWPRFDRLISSINPAYFLADTHTLIGSHTNRPRWRTRHSFTDGGIRASRWIKIQFEQMGAKCELQWYHQTFSPNVICWFDPTNPNLAQKGRVVLGAHYDSRSSFGVVSAPGADDNALGCAALLAIARSLRRNQVPIRRSIYFLAFSGTEQGLWGSQALARRWASEGIEVALMINANMIGYRVPGEPMQLGLPIQKPYSKLSNWFIANLTNIYVPELLIGSTPRQGGDEQSFGEIGFPSTSIFERAGKIANPYFRSSDDSLSKPGYDLTQALTIAKALVCLFLFIHLLNFLSL
ncbi:hypothetical protein CROQUDRAFT_38123 [Cronartium quercuum f. sp. fusiforme G11]|uniref:Peptide hydrolase n=1 Tax=Cronartium quercuum f. sp. fusiforme G11 TaxID=708437 RepID=A0A9P6TFL1_9BASI|nr:hypothetical protein CROQUDRAFT_38123 [Cronartium quercuum f. sp. fusiforme G11]